MDKLFHPTHYNGCDYLCILILKLNNVSQWVPDVSSNGDMYGVPYQYLNKNYCYNRTVLSFSTSRLLFSLGVHVFNS